MELKKLNGLTNKISRLGIGAMNFGSRVDKDTSLSIMDKAHELGFNFVDTANGYGNSEDILGDWFKRSGERENWIISTKVGWPVSEDKSDRGLSNDHINKELERSLGRLHTDWIDIYQPHYYDESVPISDLAKLYSDLVDETKISLIGGPLFTKAYQIVRWYYEAQIEGLHNIAMRQLVLSLVSRGMDKSDLIDIARTFDIPLISFGAMGGGLLTGSYNSTVDFPENGKEIFRKYHESGRVDEIMDIVSNIAKDKGVQPYQVSLAWALHHNYLLSTIIGVSDPDQLQGVVDTLEIKLSEDEINQLSEISDKFHIW